MVQHRQNAAHKERESSREEEGEDMNKNEHLNNWKDKMCEQQLDKIIPNCYSDCRDCPYGKSYWRGMNQMLKPSETRNKAVLVHHSPNNSTTRAKTQAGQPFFALFHHSPACTPYYQKLLHGSAISNAKQHSSHDRTDHHTSTNEGKNEGLPGLTTSALQ